MGDRRGYLLQALGLLPQEDLALIRCSAIYETEPWGFAEQPRFLNLVCEIETSLPSEGVLAAAKQVEQVVGRTPHPQRYGPREIDIDLLLYGETVVSGDDLEVPHPRLAERAFVLVPLLELAPQLRHPVLGLTMEALLARLTDRGGVRWWGPSPL